ncbi:methyl-accepting chemotaxis protein [Breznakiellaceae bacterium SP9]
MKIKSKLVMLIIALNLAGTGILVASLLTLSQKEISRLQSNEITDLADLNGRKVQTWLEVYMNMVRAIGQVMEQYEEIDAAQRREYMNMLVRTMVEKNPELIAASTLWEPDALDGMDAFFANTDGTGGTDEAGRFVPWWYRTKDGVFVEPLVDYEIPGAGDYYLVPRRTGKETLAEPYWYPLNGVDRLMTTVTAPVKKAGTFIGAMNIDIEITTLQEQASQIKPYEGTVAMIYSHGGIVAAHFDNKRLGGELIKTETDIAGPYLNDLIQAIQQNRQFAFTHYVESLKETMVFTSVPITVGNTGTSWALMIGVPQRVITAPVQRMAQIGILIGIITIFVTAAAAFLIARSIANPLKNMIDLFKDIGRGDLTRAITAHSKDEIGEMTSSFNGTINNIKQLIRLIKDKALSLSDIGTELQSHMTQTAAAINEITANIQSMKTQVANQSAGVDETAGAMEKITGNIDGLNTHIDRQAESVSKSSSAIEEMLANIQSVTGTLVKNADNVKVLAGASESGRAGLQEVSADIQEIARESEGLLEINAVIDNIASQTNLLSMNAAIEAAHAGEAGKGFAVVADEIRKLAESSSEQSKTISSVLKKIKTSIDKIISSTNIVLDRFEAIEDGVKTVTLQEENIRTAMEEQGEGSKQILGAVGGLNEITGLVKKGSSEMLVSSHEVIAGSKTLELISREIANGMNEMVSGAEQINRAVNRVNEISTLNKDNIDGLLNEVAKFKVEN